MSNAAMDTSSFATSFSRRSNTTSLLAAQLGFDDAGEFFATLQETLNEKEGYEQGEREQATFDAVVASYDYEKVRNGEMGAKRNEELKRRVVGVRNVAAANTDAYFAHRSSLSS